MHASPTSLEGTFKDDSGKSSEESYRASSVFSENA